MEIKQNQKKKKLKLKIKNSLFFLKLCGSRKREKKGCFKMSSSAFLLSFPEVLKETISQDDVQVQTPADPRALLMATTAWLQRQPDYLQKTTQYLGVFSTHPDDLNALGESMRQNWKISFADQVSSLNNWACSHCGEKNIQSQARCQSCSVSKIRPSDQKRFKFDALNHEQKEKESFSLEEEAEAMIRERLRVAPLKEKVVTREPPVLVKRVHACVDSQCDTPTTLFALIKADKDAESGVLLIDKVNQTIEWYHPDATSFPQEIKSILPVKWKRRVNLKTAPQTEHLDMAALWYLSRRFGYERSEGAWSGEQLSQTSFSKSDGEKVLKEFFAEIE